MIQLLCDITRKTRRLAARGGALAVALCIGWACSCCLANDDGLVGYWRFDAAADSVADLSGHGHAAHVKGGKVIADGGKHVLALDGQQQITVPSSRELDLCAGFSIAVRIKIDDLSQGHTIVFKDGQYVLRINWPGRGEPTLLLSARRRPVGAARHGRPARRRLVGPRRRHLGRPSVDDSGSTGFPSPAYMPENCPRQAIRRW